MDDERIDLSTIPSPLPEETEQSPKMGEEGGKAIIARAYLYTCMIIYVAPPSPKKDPPYYILLRRRGHATSTTIEIFQCYYYF